MKNLKSTIFRIIHHRGTDYTNTNGDSISSSSTTSTAGGGEGDILTMPSSEFGNVDDNKGADLSNTNSAKMRGMTTATPNANANKNSSSGRKLFLSNDAAIGVSPLSFESSLAAIPDNDSRLKRKKTPALLLASESSCAIVDESKSTSSSKFPSLSLPSSSATKNNKRQYNSGSANSYKQSSSSSSSILLQSITRHTSSVRKNEVETQRIANKRRLVTDMLTPIPFDKENIVRLAELKAAKLRASSSSMMNSSSSSSDNDDDGGGDWGVAKAAHTITTTTSSTTTMCERDDGTTKTKESSTTKNVEEEGGGGKAITTKTIHHIIIFIVAILLSVIVSSLEHQLTTTTTAAAATATTTTAAATIYRIVVLNLIQLLLHAIILRSFLCSVLLYTLMNIDYGQIHLVSNMRYGKLMFMSTVHTYTYRASLLLLSISCIITLIRSCVLHIIIIIAPNATTAEVGGVVPLRWNVYVCKVSALLGSSLGILVLILLLLARVLLPMANKRLTMKEG